MLWTVAQAFYERADTDSCCSVRSRDGPAGRTWIYDTTCHLLPAMDIFCKGCMFLSIPGSIADAEGSRVQRVNRLHGSFILPRKPQHPSCPPCYRGQVWRAWGTFCDKNPTSMNSRGARAPSVQSRSRHLRHLLGCKSTSVCSSKSPTGGATPMFVKFVSFIYYGFN